MEMKFNSSSLKSAHLLRDYILYLSELNELLRKKLLTGPNVEMELTICIVPNNFEY